MRIVITGVGSAGDVHPYVGLGRALRARGHDVHVITNGVFTDVVEAAGLTMHAVGDAAAYERVKQDPDLWHPRRGLRAVTTSAIEPWLEAGYDACRDLIDDGETVVIASTLAFSAKVAAEAAGAPLVQAQLAPSNFPSAHRTPHYAGLPLPAWLPKPMKRALLRTALFVADRAVTAPVNTLRKRVGLPAVGRIFGAWANAGDLLLGLFPSWFAPPQPDWPAALELVGFPLFDEGTFDPLDPALADWLDAGDPPLVFTAGSAHVFGSGFFSASIDAARVVGRRAILVTRNPDVLPTPLPDHARHVDYAPFSRLFPRAAAVVHHGGIGTTAQTLAAGVPSLVAPMAFDQFDNASRLADLGVAAALPMSRYGARRAAAALGAILSPDVAARAAHLPTARDCHFDAETACRRIEDLVPTAAPTG